ncbi:MAG: hypothetical protein NC489_18395 [Ruminococcus flavefaciens]|nr:hypothetical protein [Ruminococcus flavefaciens]
MKRKKFMALLLTAVMSVGLLAGCGDSGKDTEGSQSGGGTEQKEGSKDSSEAGGGSSQGEGTYSTDEYGFKDINGNDTITFGTNANGGYYYYLHNMFTGKNWTPFRMDENGNITHEYLTQEWVDYNMYMWRLVHDGLMDVECFTQSSDLAEEKIGNGSVLFVAAKYDSTTNATIRSGLYSAHPEMQYVPVGPLHYKTGEELRDLREMGVYGSSVIFFPETCKNVEAALTWYEYFDSPEGAAFAAYGPVGENYNFDEEGRVIFTDAYKEWYNSTDDDARREYWRQRGYSTVTKYITKNVKTWGWDIDGQLTNVEPNVWKWENEIMSIEFAPKEKNSILLLAGTYPDYNKLVVALDEGEMIRETTRAYFAATEEEARAIIEAYQKKFSSGESVQDFLDFLTNAYKENSDLLYY